MNDLKQLKDVQVDAVKKQRDFDKVSARLQKPMLPWQVPIVLVGVVMIGFFLVFTWSEPQLTADNEPELTAVYSVYGEGNPYSIWQMWVTRSTDAAVLNEFAAVLQEAKREENPEKTDLSQTLRFVYNDGSSVKYEARDNVRASYLYDVDNARYYEIMDTSRYYKITTMDGYSDAKQYAYVIIIAFVLYFVADYFIGRKMRDEDNKKKRLPQHSTQWQIVVTVSAIGLIAFLALTVPNLHYLIAVLIFGLATIMNIFLEHKFGRNGWRMLSFVVNNCWSVLVFMNLFLV